MKLAEALILRSDLNTKINDIGNRLSANCQTQEGEEPAEDPKELKRLLSKATEQLGKLIYRINKTNVMTQVDGKETLNELLAKREALMLKRSMLLNAANAANPKINRYSASEIKLVRTLDVQSLRKEIDDISAEFRKIDNKVQAINWTTELL